MVDLLGWFHEEVNPIVTVAAYPLKRIVKVCTAGCPYLPSFNWKSIAHSSRKRVQKNMSKFPITFALKYESEMFRSSRTRDCASNEWHERVCRTLSFRYGMFRKRRSLSGGFTLIEMMIVVALIAILAAIALPSYESYVRKSRARAAGADLGALALNLENVRQLQLDYKVFAKGTTANSQNFPGWAASMGQYFIYTLESTASTYTLYATGQAGLAGCSLTLDNTGVKTATSACGITTW